MKKVTVLVDGSKKKFDELCYYLNENTSNKNKKKILVGDTELSGKHSEYDYLERLIAYLIISKYEILLARFSGSEKVVRELGEVYAEMVVAVSFNKNNGFYIENLENSFLDILNLLTEKEKKI